MIDLNLNIKGKSYLSDGFQKLFFLYLFNITAMSDTQQQKKLELTQSIESQGQKIRQLKAEKAEKSVIDAEVAALLDLKKQLAVLEGTDGKSGKAAKTSFTLKTPKVCCPR